MSGYLEKLLALRDGTLDPESFSHADHVGVAYEAIDRHEVFEAVAIVASGLRGVAERAEVPRKFNATITQAFMSLIAERMASGTYANAEAFIAANPDLQEKTVLSPWYSTDRLTSDLARQVPLLPDCFQPG